MPENFRIRFTNFTGLDFGSARKCRLPAPKANVVGEETLLRGGIAALSATGNIKGRLLNHTLDRCEDGASMNLSGSIPGAIIPSPTDYTITEGLTAGASAIAAYSAGGGVYFWKKARGFDVGLYGSISVGVVTNLGAGGGVQIGYFFGPAPSTLGGDSVELAVTVDAGISIGGSMFLSAPPSGLTPPAGTSLSSWLSSLAASTRSWRPQVIGVAYTLSVGVSALPVDIAVMPGRTWTRSVVSR